MKTLTYSMINAFLACRKKYEYRYVRQIVPAETPVRFGFGSVVHAALEFWFKYRDKKSALDLIFDERYSQDLSDEDILKAHACVERYIERWGVEENWNVLAVEDKFSAPLINPKTKRKSRIWEVQGKVDGLVEVDDELYLLEHKTTSSITPEYLSRILIDSQLAVYALHYQSEKSDKKIVGAIYDIIEKPSIRMKKGETEEEFEARKAELLAKSKTGKTTAKRQLPEAPEEFHERLMQSITDANFHRETIRFDDSLLKTANEEIWETAKDIYNAKTLYKNTGQCNVFGACPYLPLCLANGLMSCCDVEYKHMRAHSELYSD